MERDIRDAPHIHYDDVMGLNFINNKGSYVFRRHYRQGLRSHIMEVLDRTDLERETKGIVEGGIRWFPRARPLKMLRIFRTKFRHLEEALNEIRTIKIIEKYLAPHHLARSNEFLVDYHWNGRRDFLLCGLQDYVDGEIMDPWGPMDEGRLKEIFKRMGVRDGAFSQETSEEWIRRVREKAESLTKRIKKMIYQESYVPDLAGIGNLLLIPSGHIKLVDINNISRVTFEKAVPVDNKGYPVCDKSIEALSLLEQRLLGRKIDMGEKLYKTYLDPQRMKKVKFLLKQFFLCLVQ
ncbi:MAG: hypothetical protein V1930_00285 [Pseudomonadota bacterium]